MKLNVYVLGKHVAVLDSVNELNSVLTYLPDTAPQNLVSLTMPVRSESYVWDDELHPVGKPLADLIGLSDGAPHHLHRRINQDIPLDHEPWHEHDSLTCICNRR